MNQDQFCGNCGLPRSSGDMRCPRCGRPYIDDAPAMNPLTPTQVSPNTTQPIWHTPPPFYPTPPVPQTATGARWTIRLLIGQSVLVLVMLVVIIVLIVRPVGGANQQGSVLPTATTALSPTTQPTPPYANNLSSTNFNLFINAFADALQEQDVASIEPHTDTLNFLIACDQRDSLPGTCDSSWVGLKTQLVADTVRISLPQDATLNPLPPISSICPDLPNDNQFIGVMGMFDQTTGTLPLAHFGTAVLGFECVTCGSETTWGWRVLYLC